MYLHCVWRLSWSATTLDTLMYKLGLCIGRVIHNDVTNLLFWSPPPSYAMSTPFNHYVSSIYIQFLTPPTFMDGPIYRKFEHWFFVLFTYPFIQGRRKIWKSGGIICSPLVEIGLTDLPKSEGGDRLLLCLTQFLRPCDLWSWVVCLFLFAEMTYLSDFHSMQFSLLNREHP